MKRRSLEKIILQDINHDEVATMYDDGGLFQWIGVSDEYDIFSLACFNNVSDSKQRYDILNVTLSTIKP